MEIKDLGMEELKEIIGKAKLSISEYSFDKNDLNNLEDDKEVEDLSEKISDEMKC